MDLMFLPVIFFVLIVTMMGLFTVKQTSTAIVQRLGKFHSIRHAGLNFKIPFIDSIAGRLSLKIQQLDVNVETKTKDDVFVRLKVSVQFKVLRDGIYDAFYK
jgi:regulator of protease activity HflC (stomatin/prohibitin superfamily)